MEGSTLGTGGKIHWRVDSREVKFLLKVPGLGSLHLEESIPTTDIGQDCPIELHGKTIANVNPQERQLGLLTALKGNSSF